MPWWYIINAVMAVLLVVTIVRLVQEARAEEPSKGRMAWEALWGVIVTLVLLHNLGVIRLF